MITTIISFLSSLLVGTTLMMGAAVNLPMVHAQPTPSQPAQPAGFFNSKTYRRFNDHFGRRSAQNDRQVRQGLILAVVSVTGQSPVEVLQALKTGNSIAEIAQSAGKTPDEVLSVYNQTAAYLLDQAAQKRSIPESTQQLRLEWYRQAGELEIELPGMLPVFPSLPELRAAALVATLRVSGIDRAQLRQELRSGSSLDDILVKNGHTSQETVDAAMKRIDTRLGVAGDNSKLTNAQRQAWSASIHDLLSQIMQVPFVQPATSALAR